jgi:exoribonuclease R
MTTRPMTTRPNPDPAAATIERAFDRQREELGIRRGFPPEVEAEAREAAARDPAADASRADRTAIPFVTIDPPGSRDLDQALCIQRSGEGFRLWYAIADVGFFVDRGGAVEREAWLRGETFYAPDCKEPLYPPALSEGPASLLPEEDRPSVLFGFELDGRAEIVSSSIERARVRSRAQLTYAQALEHVEGGGALFRDREWAESLVLLKEFGEQRRRREAERGGVSLPILSQHVQRSATARLGYALEYERPVASEDWNAQVSLLTGHLAALRMSAAKVGILRVLPPADPERIEHFRRVARALGFQWPDGVGYGDFLRSLDPDHPRVTPLVWQARRVMAGSDYVAFDGELPAQPLHHALAFAYAHVTAPLRRLADRYVLDLLVQLETGGRPSPVEVETLAKVAEVMNQAETKSSRLDRRVVDVAEAWTLRGRVDERFPAVVLGVRGREVEVQIEEPPVRADAARPEHGRWLELGERVQVRLASVDPEEGKLAFTLEE